MAIAARALIADGLAERVAIYDFDIHHGNGTQDVFYEDPEVVFYSIHRYGGGFYPGTGAADDQRPRVRARRGQRPFKTQRAMQVHRFLHGEQLGGGRRPGCAG